MNNAYILGCSHVSGSELEGWGIGHRTNFNIENSFAAQFAKLLRYHPINLAKPGASNDFIFREFNELIESGKIDEHDLIIVFWTGEERTEIQDPFTKNWVQFSLGMSTQFPEYNDTYKQFYNLYQKLMCMEPMRGRLNKIKNILALNNLAKLKNIRVINGDSFMESMFEGKFDLDWLFPHSSFSTWARENKYKESPEWHHYELKAHTDFADLCLKEFLSKITGKSANNFWYDFLQKNLTNLSEKNKDIAIKFTRSVVPKNNYHYNFCLDGWSSEGHFAIIHELLSTNKYQSIPYVYRKGKVRFFNEHEGYCTDYIFETIHWLILVHSWNPKNVVYENLAENIQEMYNSFCEKKNIKEKINVKKLQGYNNPKLPQYEVTPKSVTEKSIEQKKLYLNLNWNGWDHRFLMIAYLHDKGLIDDGNISTPAYNKFAHSKEKDFEVLYNSIEQQVNKNTIQDGTNLLKNLYSLKEKYPLVLDDRSTFKNPDDCWHLSDSKFNMKTLRQNSLIEVVSETYTDRVVFFSEKTFYPIVYGLPFIQLNSRHALRHLRNLGYKTFEPYIDESYDEEFDMPLRVKMIADEIKRLKILREKTPEVFYSNYKQMLEICKHNKTVFENVQV